MALLVVVAPRPLAAEEPPARPGTAPAIANGTRVRVTTASQGRIVGYVAQVQGDALLIDRRRKDAFERLKLPRRDISKLEVSRGPSRRGRGAGIGALVGFVGGVALGVVGGDSNCPADPGPATWTNFSEKLGSSLCIGKAEGAAVGAILLMPIGALLGAAAAPGERWRSIDPSAIAVRVAIPPGGGVEARVSLRF